MYQFQPENRFLLSIEEDLVAISKQNASNFNLDKSISKCKLQCGSNEPIVGHQLPKKKVKRAKKPITENDKVIVLLV